MQIVPQEFELNTLKQVVEQSPVSIVITDVNGSIKYVNPAFTEITGYAQKEVLGKNPSILKSGAHSKEFYRDVWETISSGKTWKGEFLNKKKDGGLYWESATLSPVFNDSGNIVFYVGSKEDISKKKFAEEELVRNEMQFKNLAQTAPVLIAKIDRDGNLLYFNNYLLNVNTEEPNNILDLFPSNNKTGLRKRILNVFEDAIQDSFEINSVIEGEQLETFVVKISPNIIGGMVESAIVVAQNISELIEARKTARKSENDLISLADNVGDLIWILDRNYQMSFVTPSVEAITGYTAENFIDSGFDVCFSEENLINYRNTISKLADTLDSSQIEIWECELKKKNGESIWVEMHVRVVLTESKEFNGVVGVTRDVTERKRSEQAIYNSEVKFRSFFENSNAIILVIDPVEKKVVNANKIAIDYYGYSPGEFLELNIQRELVGLIEAVQVEVMEEANDAKNVYAQRHRTKDGEYRDVEIFPAKVEVNGKILIYAIIQDISQRKKAVEALKESESKKLALLKIIPDLIFVLDKEGTFLDIYTDNPERLIVPPHKLLGKKCYHIFPEGFCSIMSDSIENAFKTRNIQTFEYRYKRDLINYIVEEVRVIVSGKNEVLAIIRDITSQKENEIELKRAWEEAKEANRVKDAFLANISHEIRTPINSILGFGELLQLELTNSEHIQYINSIRTSSKSLLNLINDLLDLSKIEAGKMTVIKEPVNIRVLLNEIENVFSIKLIEKGLDFELNVSEGCPVSIQSDEMRIRQILINLVSNAVKFTDKGKIRVSVKTFNSNIVDYAEYVDLKIEVEDTGIGIPESNLQQIFEAFKQQEQQDAKKYGGTGLGLTITKRLAELLNGTIQVTSKPGSGSLFTIIIYNLEVLQPATTRLVPDTAIFKIGHIQFESAKILIADDVETNREFLKGVFKGSDMVFVEAANGVQAIEQIKKYSPKIALLDIKMPGKDGLDVAKFIKTHAAYKHIITIGVSATPVSFEIDARTIYLDEFVSKPIDTPDILQKISNYIPVLSRKEEKQENIIEPGLLNEVEEIFRVKDVMDTELTPLFEEVSGTSSFDDYIRFAKLLIKKGQEFKIKSLTYLGESIYEATKTFDLEQINILFAEYKKFVAEYSKNKDE